jgi:cytochrome c
MTRIRLLPLVFLALACAREPAAPAHTPAPAGDAAKGKDAILRYGCTSCHVIPGIEGPRGMVGPPLDHWTTRKVLGKSTPNTHANVVQWIRSPQSMDPENTMPNLDVSEGDAHDIAAYLETLK